MVKLLSQHWYANSWGKSPILITVYWKTLFSAQQALVPGDWAEGGESSVTLVEQAKEQSCSHRAARNA